VDLDSKNIDTLKELNKLDELIIDGKYIFINLKIYLKKLEGQEY